MDRGHAHDVAVHGRRVQLGDLGRAPECVKVAWNQAYEATANLENQSFRSSLFFIPDTRFGTINVSGINSLGPDTQSPTFVNLKSAQFIDNLAWTRGGHVVKAGFSDTHYMNDQDSSFDYGGLYTFTSVDNFVLSRAGTFEGQAPGSTTARRWRQDLIGLYAQDDWTARRNLTLNLGRPLRVHHPTARARRPIVGAAGPPVVELRDGRRPSSRTRR